MLNESIERNRAVLNALHRYNRTSDSCWHRNAKGQLTNVFKNDMEMCEWHIR